MNSSAPTHTSNIPPVGSNHSVGVDVGAAEAEKASIPGWSEDCSGEGWHSIYRTLPVGRTVASIHLDVTDACNLACIYCYKWQKKAVHMDGATARSAIDWFLEASCDYKGELLVNFMGGEPLLRFDLIQDIVLYGKCRARQRGRELHFACTTNCTHLTEEILDFWRRFGMGFHCSIDGIPEVQDANRPFLNGGASSEEIAKNIPKILSYQPWAMARATISPTSVAFLIQSAKYLAGLGFRSITFQPATNCDWKEDAIEALRHEYGGVVRFYLEGIASGRPIHIDELERGLRALHSADSTPRSPCGAGQGIMLIDPRGDIYPCTRFGPHLCNGDFRFGRIGGSFNHRLRDVFLHYDLAADAKAACCQCGAKLTCQGWCQCECAEKMISFYDPGKLYCQIVRLLHDEIVKLDASLRTHHPGFLQSLLRQNR